MNLKSVSIFFLRVLLIFVFAGAGIAKFKGLEISTPLFQALGMEPGGRYFIGFLELLTALLLLLPFTVTSGALLGWGILSGALLAHLTKVGVGGDMLPMTTAALSGWLACGALIFLRRDQITFIRHMFDCQRDRDA